MVSAILAARHRIFVLVITSLFVLFFLCTINFFFFLLPTEKKLRTGLVGAGRAADRGGGLLLAVGEDSRDQSQQ